MLVHLIFKWPEIFFIHLQRLRDHGSGQYQFFTIYYATTTTHETHHICVYIFFIQVSAQTKTKRNDLLLRPHNNRILCLCVCVWKNFRILVFPAISHIFIHFIRLHASCACIRCHSQIHENSSSFFFFFASRI